MARRDAEWLALRVLGGPGDMPLFEEALEVRLLPDAGPASWSADRLRFLKSALVAPLRALFSRAPELAGDAVAYDPAAGRERMREYRRHFVRRHFGREVDFVGRGQLRAADSRRGPWLRWYLFGLVIAVLALFDTSSRRYSWWAGVFADIGALMRVERATDRVYLFGLYDRRPYVIGAFLARHTNIAAYLVYQNIPLYRNCRHLHFETPVVLTSRVNLSEVEHYRALGQFKASEVIYASQEFGLDLEGLEPGTPVYDLGFFSSGEWARKGGLYQSDDLEAVRSGAYLGNEYARKAEDIVEALASYARRHDLTLRIYPHPLERRLWSEHSIAPPYAGLVDRKTTSVDYEGESSRSKMYECTAAVSLQSSFIWERLDLGLEASFIYEWADREKNPFDRVALGCYAENLFRDPEELAAKLDAVFT